MPDLIAKSALAGHAALTLRDTTLAEAPMTSITSIAPFPNKGKAVDAALKPLGLKFPAPNTASTKDGARLLWTGREQAFLIGTAAPDMGDAAAVTDQSDGWVILTLSGPLARDTLARLVPLDLRDAAFPVGMTTRSGLNHMALILTRTGDAVYEIMTFRSMARTAWHELAEALETQAARAAHLA